MLYCNDRERRDNKCWHTVLTSSNLFHSVKVKYYIPLWHLILCWHFVLPSLKWCSVQCIVFTPATILTASIIGNSKCTLVMKFIAELQKTMTTKGSQMQSQTHTYTHTQPFYSSMDFDQDNTGEPVPEEIFTHSHRLWSSIVPYLLHPSNTIHGIFPVLSTRLTTVLSVGRPPARLTYLL